MLELLNERSEFSRSYTLLNALAFGESPAKPLVSQDLTG